MKHNMKHIMKHNMKHNNIIISRHYALSLLFSNNK